MAGALVLATIGVSDQVADGEKPLLQITLGLLIGGLLHTSGLVLLRRLARHRMGVLLVVAA